MHLDHNRGMLTMGLGQHQLPAVGFARRSQLALAVGLILLAVGLAVNWRVSQARGEDFDHFYIVGTALARGLDLYTVRDLATVYRDVDGKDTYTPWGVFNNPSVGIAVLPLTILPINVARVIWFLLSVGVLLVGVDQLMREFTPQWSLGVRVLVLGALMCTSAARWAFFYLQPAPLIFGLLCLYLVGLNRGHSAVAWAMATFVLFLKATLALPFIALALLQRRYALAGCALAVWALANSIGFARMGGIDAVRGYQTNMARFEQADQLNYPDFRAPNSMQQLDWPYLLNAINADLPRSDAMGTFLTGLSVLVLVWQWLRCRTVLRRDELTVAFLGPLVCLSLLSVYHHHYDAIALFGPMIIYLGGRRRHTSYLIALFVVPVVLFAGLYQVEEAQILIAHAFGYNASMATKLLGVVSVTVAFVASLLLLDEVARSRVRSAGHRARPPSTSTQLTEN